MWGIISWIILGLIAGWAASKIVGGSGQGVFRDIVLGIIGALVGGFLSAWAFGRGIEGLDPKSIIIAIIGSVIVLWVYHAVTGRRTI